MPQAGVAQQHLDMRGKGIGQPSTLMLPNRSGSHALHRG